ncbi:uncharacterized protein LTHEOB_6138 [Neofusicoccum parvum]|uniref:Uncharacterized protein LTHEOB_6138 n=1 Tax=Neofusicoccum parvum TaxID=310453 RepID=A0ACB5RNX9_9PEZI|nr:uncharacterized protein LTHEOB_6138 [Neofusicoccum parvum]
MHLTRNNFTALVAVTARILGATASPVERRFDSTLSATSTVPTAALVETTISSEATSAEAALSTATGPEDATAISASSTSNAAATAISSLTPSHDFPVCNDPNARPFCLPANNTDVYYGETYYVTWNSNNFPLNSSITILLNWLNDTQKQVWSSGPVNNKIGATAVDMKEEWLQGYTAYNLTFFALHFDSVADNPVTIYDGPTVQLKAKPPHHYEPPPVTKVPNELGLKVGLPVCLGFVVIVVAGLFFGMRKQRRIGLGNVMGRNRGYGSRKSRRQRLGFGGPKKEDALLQEQELLADPQYRDHSPPAPTPLSPVATPAEDGRNAFREEIERQKTGGRN